MLITLVVALLIANGGQASGHGRARCRNYHPWCRRQGTYRLIKNVNSKLYTRISLLGDATDAQSLLNFDANNFRRHQQRIGRTPDDTARRAEKALLFFKEAYGIDCTNVPAQHLVLPGDQNCTGPVQVSAFTVSQDDNRRATSIEIGNRVRSLHRAPVSFGGWRIVVKSDIQVTGTLFNETLKAKDCISHCIVFGELIYPGLKGGPIYFESAIPARNFVIGKVTKRYIQHSVSHSIYGKGTRDSVVTRIDGTILANTVVLTFPLSSGQFGY